jgi:hypothetical protein
MATICNRDGCNNPAEGHHYPVVPNSNYCRICAVAINKRVGRTVVIPPDGLWNIKSPNGKFMLGCSCDKETCIASFDQHYFGMGYKIVKVDNSHLGRFV